MIATSSHLLWYTTRATGVVALVLLTGTVVLGVLTSVRFGTAQWPRFALQDIHRRVSLLAMVFIAFHVVTTVSDSYAPIGWLSVLVPFTSPYRRLWLGLGTVALDLLLAVAVTSLLRRRINHRVWRGIHWLSYASWPVALMHGLGTGTDPHLGWMGLLTVICVAAVLAAIGWRLVSGWHGRTLERVLAGAGSLLGIVGIAAWAANGPLKPGWAARAGTPAYLLGAHAPSSSSSASSGTSAPPPAPGQAGPPPQGSSSASTTLPAPPYRADLAGSVSQSFVSGGLEKIDMKARTVGSLDAVLDVVIVGSPDSSGGVAMQKSQATFGTPRTPSQFQGSIVGLEGSQLLLGLRDQSGASLSLQVDVSIAGNQLTGQLATVSPGAGGLG